MSLRSAAQAARSGRIALLISRIGEACLVGFCFFFLKKKVSVKKGVVMRALIHQHLQGRDAVQKKKIGLRVNEKS